MRTYDLNVEPLIQKRRTCYTVQIERDGVRYYQSFRFADYDPDDALALARAWRDEQLDRLGRPAPKKDYVALRRQHSAGVCPRCTIPYDLHWTCRVCGCHGHEIPRTRSNLCGWCADEGKG